MAGRSRPSIGDSLLYGVALLVAVAFGARLVWALFAPLIPHLIVGLLLLGVFAIMVGRRRF